MAWLSRTVPMFPVTLPGWAVHGLSFSLTDGTWTVIELNDGGVSTMPAGIDLGALYEALADV